MIVRIRRLLQINYLYRLPNSGHSLSRRESFSRPGYQIRRGENFPAAPTTTYVLFPYATSLEHNLPV